jgi:hypothetical protein
LPRGDVNALIAAEKKKKKKIGTRNKMRDPIWKSGEVGVVQLEDWTW